MDLNENSEKKAELIIRCIHPNLEWLPEEGPYYTMSTLFENIRLKVHPNILCRSQHFKSLLEQDPQILSSNKPIEIKIISQKNQISTESLLLSLNYLETQNLYDLELTRKTMLPFLLASNFLKIPALEAYCADFTSNNIQGKNLIDIANASIKINNKRLLNQTYIYIKTLILSRFGQLELPNHMKDDNRLIYSCPILKDTKTNSNLNLEIFANKAHDSHIDRKLYHVSFYIGNS